MNIFKRKESLYRLLAVLIAVTMVFTCLMPIPTVYGEDIPYDYQGAGGTVAGGKDNNSIKMLDPSDITVESKTDEGFTNRINTVIDGTSEIVFSFVMSAGQNQFNEETFKNISMPLIKIYNEDESEVIAEYSGGTGDLKYLGGQSNTGQNDGSGWIKVGVDANVLEGGEYVLYFGSGIPGNNLEKILGVWLKFKFTVTGLDLTELLSQAEELTKEENICADGNYEWGKYPESAKEALLSVKTTAEAALNAEEDAQKAAALTLRNAINTFKAARYVKVDSVTINDVPSDVSVGDSGRMAATLVTDPDEAQYRKVKWTATDNININEDTGEWQVNYGGNAAVTATAVTMTSGDTEKESASCSFSVSSYDKDGMLCINLPPSGERPEELIALTGETPAEIEKLRITASEGCALTSGELTKIKNSLTGLQKLDIKDSGLTDIASVALENYTSLSEIVLPEKLVTIGSFTFSGCTSLSKIEFPATLKAVGRLAFNNCSSLKELSVKAVNPPTLTTSKGNSSFEGTGLTTVTVPYSCKTDYEKSVSWSGFTTVKEDQEVKLIVEVDESGTFEEKALSLMNGQGITEEDVNTLIITTSGEGRLTRNEDHAYLQDSFFYVTTLDMGGAETEDHKCNANYFKGRISLKNIILPPDTETIGSSAFSGCTNLKEVKLPSKLTKIGSGAFSGCLSLTNAIICDAAEPPEYDGSPFDPDVVDTFIVPPASADKYKKATGWSAFNIKSQLEISLDTAYIKLEATESRTIKANVKTYSDNDTRVQWSSSDSRIAAVDQNGKVTGIRAGTTVITASTLEGGLTAVCNVTVESVGSPALKLISTGYNSAKISWAGVIGSSGYEIYRSTAANGTYTRLNVLTASTLGYTDAGIYTGRRYYYKVRAYKDVNGVRYTGAFSPAISALPSLRKPTGIKTRRGGKNKITVSWKKVAGASGYTVYRSIRKTKGFKAVKTLKGKKFKFTDGKLKKGRRYYYKIKAYRIIKGKKVYSGFSVRVSRKAR